MPASRKFFRALLKLYPREFRSTYGPRMEEAFMAAMQHHASSPFRVLFAWVRILWDTAFHAIDLRFPRRGRKGSSQVEPRRYTPRSPREAASSGSLLSDLLQDLRYSLRTLKKNPTFTIVIIVIAGLGMSLTTLAFTTVNAAFLRPLPHVRAPGEVVVISRELPSRLGRPARISYDDFILLRERSNTLTELVGEVPYRELLLRTSSDQDRQVIGGEVTESYFEALGIPMVLGRGILPEDEGAGNDVAVLGHATWMREFGGSRDALGQTVRVDGRQYTVVGVAPQGLGFLSGEPVEAAVWIPVRSRYRDAHDWNGFLVAGRPMPGVTLPQIQADLDGLVAGLVESDSDRWVEDAGTVALRARTERQARLDQVGGPRGVASIIIYLVFIGLIMLITCSNVAGLLLNRALKRRAEIAMRLALGAGRGRLVRHLLAESVFLFSIAGALSLLLLQWGTQALADGWGASLPAVADITLDLKVAAAAFGITLVSGVVFGLVPALQATRPELSSALRGIHGGGKPNRSRARNFLVRVQVTASMVLVAISGLIVRDIQRAETIDIGFDPSGIAVASLNLAHGDYGPEEGGRWLETLSERLEGLPGVDGVALAAWVPLSGSRWTQWIRPEGMDLAPGQSLYAVYNAVTPGYFEMVGMPVVAGRAFEDTDRSDAPEVVVVNQAFVRRYWPGQDPIGKSVSLGEGRPGAQVIGVVRDAMYGVTDLRNGEAEPHIWGARSQGYSSTTAVHVGTRGALGPVLAAIRREIRLLDEDLPLGQLTSMESLTGEALFEERASAILFGSFSVLALFLAALGIYGVMAHAVMERTREMGVRLAVGAAPGRVVGMVLVESIKLSATGILVGIPLAVLVGLGIRTLLVGVSVLDPLSLSGSALVLVSAAAAAGIIPAMKAATTDPLLSLKSE